MTGKIRAIVRRALGRFGYILLHVNYTRFGYSLFTDVKSICRDWDWSIDVVFDVGANVGQFAGEALEGFPHAQIYSFEPFPSSFERLTAAHTHPRFSAHNLALCDQAGPVEFFVYGDFGESSHINSLVSNAQFPKKFGYRARNIEVEGNTIDNFCLIHNIARIDILKIDTEGSEMIVLLGAEAMLKSASVRFVYFEFNTLLPETGTTGGALLPIAEFLKGFGYEYLVTYTDYVLKDRQVAVCANALFARPPSAGPAIGLSDSGELASRASIG
jgi:FkbM family methyltransferase